METKIEAQDTSKIANLACQELYSFDVFDTLITRTTATPKGIFALIQEKLMCNNEFSNYPLGLKNNFYCIRIDAEKIQRRIQKDKCDISEVTIDDIYNHIKDSFSLTKEESEILKNLELQTEVKNFLPIEDNIQKLKNLHYEGKKVVLISDMYLQANIIRDFLRPYIPFIDEIEVFSSCEIMCAKGNGSAFEYVHKKLGIQTNNWHHLGDNENSDYKQAKKYGILSKLFKYPKFQSYEKTILNEYENDLEYQKLIGLCKNIRLFNNINDLKTKAGICLAGPILTSYIQLVLENSLKQGINRLYFIARDGYILKEIADILIEKNNYPIKTKYIYGSRIAWRVPSVINSDYESIVETLSFILYDFNSLAKSLHVTKKELGQFINKKYHNKNFSKKLQAQLKKDLSQNQEFLNLIIKRNQENRILIKEYLLQEIDFSDDKFAFVDLCGSGNANNCLSKIIKEFYDNNINVFYLSTHTPVATTENVKRFVYKYSDRALMWLEILARTNHGQTLGYKKDNLTSKIVPVLEKVDSDFWINWKFDNYLNGIKLFAKYNNIALSQSIINKYLWIIQRKDETIMEVYGDMLFSAIGEENTLFAPAISLKEAICYLLFNKPLKTTVLPWSISRSKKIVQKIIKFKQKMWI